MFGAKNTHRNPGISSQNADKKKCILLFILLILKKFEYGVLHAWLNFGISTQAGKSVSTTSVAIPH